jgi:hypothetical protein
LYAGGRAGRYAYASLCSSMMPNFTAAGARRWQRLFPFCVVSALLIKTSPNQSTPSTKTGQLHVKSCGRHMREPGGKKDQIVLDEGRHRHASYYKQQKGIPKKLFLYLHSQRVCVEVNY